MHWKEKGFLVRGAIIFVIIILISVVLYLTAGYFQNRPTPEMRKYLNSLEELAEREKEDTYGGDTPEETLRMFIDALKKEDIELAAKYFVVSEQEKKLREFRAGNSSGGLSELANFLSRDKTGKEASEGVFMFSYPNQDGTNSSLVILKKNINSKWKIYEL
jgi:hypothetical protein